jgi:hypothetical protein
LRIGPSRPTVAERATPADTIGSVSCISEYSLLSDQYRREKMPEYTTIFEIGHNSFSWWFPLFGLVVGVFGIAVIRQKKADYRWAYAIAAFSIVWSLLSFSEIAVGDREFQRAYASGNYLVSEGPVESFWEEPQGKGECFFVQNKRFCYSDFIIVPGFRNTAWHGGPIRPGLPVRVSYVGDTIVKLEIRSDSAPSRSEIRIRKVEAIARDSFVFLVFGAAVLAINAGLWISGRLRRKPQSKPSH